MQLNEMTYGEKLAMASCIYCGAPLILDARHCNHCGCDYISMSDEEIQELEIDNYPDTFLKVNVIMGRDNINYGIFKKLYPIKEGTLIIEYMGKVKQLQKIIDNNKEIGFNNKRENLILEFKGKKLFFEGCIMTSYKKIETKKEISIMFDNFHIIKIV